MTISLFPSTLHHLLSKWRHNAIFTYESTAKQIAYAVCLLHKHTLNNYLGSWTHLLFLNVPLLTGEHSGCHVKLHCDVSIICLTAAETPRLSSVTSVQRNDNTVEAKATEILKYILKNYFSMENSNNKSNKKAIMEVLWGESHSKQINIYATSVRFSGGTDAMIFNYKTVMCSISSLSLTKHRLLRDAIKQVFYLK